MILILLGYFAFENLDIM